MRKPLRRLKFDRYEIYLSDSSWNKQRVSVFVSFLKKAGITSWFDIHELAPGERWDDKLQQALRESSIIVVILSENSVENPWIFFELGAAIADKKRIIPVLVGNVESKRIPSFLRRLQFINETSPAEAGKRIAKAIEKTSPKEMQPVEA